MESLMVILAVLALCQTAWTASGGKEETAAVPEDILFQEAKCVEERNVCVLELEQEFSRLHKTPKGFHVNRKVKCNYGDEVTKVMTCCHGLVNTLNSRLKERDPQISTILTVLRSQKCTRVYCDDEECEYIGCSVDHSQSCGTTAIQSPTHTLLTDSAEGGSGDTPSTKSSSSSTLDPSALKGDQGAIAGTTVIVVSCLLTFLAGLGGATLIFWFCRRRRATKGSERAVTSNGSTATITREDNESLYEELQDDHSGYDKKPSPKRSTASVNEHTYIPEQPSAPPPPAYNVISANARGEVTSPTHYSEPGDHHIRQKLPEAPPPAAEPPRSLADVGRGRSAGDRTNPSLPPPPSQAPPASSYSLAQPLRGGRRREAGGGRGRGHGREAERNPAESSPLPDGYFIMEENAAAADVSASREAMPLPPPTLLPRKKEKKTAASGQLTAAGTTSGGTGGCSYYSSLQSPPAAETENSQYAALGGGVGKNGYLADDEDDDGGASGDYLEILPEYSLQKPID